jgi:hypothetical protein
MSSGRLVCPFVIPPFVLRYAQLLLVLGGKMNCDATHVGCGGCEAQENKMPSRIFGYMTLQFESEQWCGPSECVR